MTKETIQTIIETNQYISNASRETKNKLINNSVELHVEQGQTIIREGVNEEYCFIIKEGAVRLLTKDIHSNELYTVGRGDNGDLLGFVNLLRQECCEAIIARRPSSLIAIPTRIVYETIREDEEFARSLEKLENACEKATILKKIVAVMQPSPISIKEWIIDNLKSEGNEQIKVLSSSIGGYKDKVGKQVNKEEIEQIELASELKLRFIGLEIKNKIEQKGKEIEDQNNQSKIYWKPTSEFQPDKIGIKSAVKGSDLYGFKLVKGKDKISITLAILRMIARAYNTPCPIDILEKAIEGSIERTGNVPVHGMGQLIEAMGLQTQIGDLTISQFMKTEMPVIVVKQAKYILVVEAKKGEIIYADPEKGWSKLPIDELDSNNDKIKSIKTLIIKRLADTPQKQFGLSWFGPVLKRFKWSLTQVLLASLFIQLFQLANPLLLQQIIDKVINQSNLTALQILGAALVGAALFQGLLTAVRTWLLIDTTDRMDLILGSQVIDRLLRLPLRFFENRPVGELSQRLGELANLRSFLTGTAITSMLDILFAIIYILIMFLYSPTLTFVALATIPLYILMVLFIAPVYKRIIRRQAQYSAKTQSLLIETLSGIQTVKAQHFELSSRWRWQERYSGQISEGFKGVILGTTANEVGNFLNQLSSLLIIWVGVYQVVDGNLSLGQLIAFRIIAGYVTGPILRLSSLWQGFQQVNISMERLADIIDQKPEEEDNAKEMIGLPPINGEIVFQSINFRFGKNGPYQIKNLDLTVKEGSFVGIVGQSGSGKSTLMKLLPRLYEPQEGRILIDNYDISKVKLDTVRQQIGIVPQDCLLFEGTVRENISMNNPEAKTETIINAAKAASAHDFIMELPNGYGTMLGERGAGLSGGQRQRIAIARTLIQNPNLLILDEATSALDYDTESNVCENLQTKLNNKTVFFITHRLSTVKRADLIILMHEGEIAEQGTHDELIKLNGRYATLYSHQGD